MCLILEIMGIPLFSIENSILKDIIMIYFDQHRGLELFICINPKLDFTCHLTSIVNF